MSRLVTNCLAALALLLLWQSGLATDSSRIAPSSATKSYPIHLSPQTKDNHLLAEATKPNTYSDKSEHQILDKNSSDNLTTWFTGLLVLVGTIQAAFFFIQLRIMKSGIKDATTAANAAALNAEASRKSADVAERTMVIESRAFISATGIYTDCMPQKDGSFVWKLRPKWTNTGKTPTRNFSLYVDYEITDKIREKGEIDLNKIRNTPGVGHLAPYQAMFGGQIPFEKDTFLTPDLVEHLIVGKQFLYMWGWAKYNDVFPNTEMHITKFCWLVAPVGYPRAFKLHSTKMEETLNFNYLNHLEGNCADEECGAQPAQ